MRVKYNLLLLLVSMTKEIVNIPKKLQDGRGREDDMSNIDNRNQHALT